MLIFVMLVALLCLMVSVIATTIGYQRRMRRYRTQVQTWQVIASQWQWQAQHTESLLA